MLTVTIDGLDVYAYHGVPDSEQEVGHRYRIDIELEVESAADASDRIEDTVDYAAAASVATGVVAGTQCRTVERLARLVSEALLAMSDRVHEVTVEIRKPLPPAPIPVEAVGCRLTLRRGQTS